VWMNGMYIRATDSSTLLDRVVEFADREETAHYWSSRVPGPNETDPHKKLRALKLLSKAATEDRAHALEALKLEQERVTNLADFGEACEFFFVDKVEFDSKAVEKWFHEPHVGGLFDWLLTELDNRQSIIDNPAGYEGLLRDAQTHLGLDKLGPIVHPVRVALTGKTVGPGLFELMAVLGAEKVKARLKVARGHIRT